MSPTRKQTAPPPGHLVTGEAAKRAGVGRKAIVHAIRRGELHGLRRAADHGIYVAEAELDNWIKARGALVPLAPKEEA